MTDIGTLINGIIDREGGYSNNPNDAGGETNMGITKFVARAHGYAGDMRALPRGTAEMIYREIYWTTPHFDQVAAIMPKVGAELLDTGVNMGPLVASKFLQRALTTLNRGGKDFPDLEVDGRIGKLTLYALSKFEKKRGAMAETVLLRMLESQQAMRYIDIAEAKPSQEDFMYGWVANRVGDVK